MSKKGTWPQALITFFWPLVAILALRWVFVEPFVIPSGSMIPTLLVHDHIFVKKYSLGLRVPFTDKWLLRWREPQRGEITVFKYPHNTDVFYIKRLVGLPGDVIEVKAGHIRINGDEWVTLPQDMDPYDLGSNDGFDYFLEASRPGERHTIRFLKNREELARELKTFTVPAGQYFFMGDNRDQSSDSRYWGFVKQEYIVGPAWFIWLSCENTLPSLTYVCDPTQIRWERLGQFLH